MPASPSPEDSKLEACMARLDRALTAVHRSVKDQEPTPPTPATKGFSPAHYKKTRAVLIQAAEEALEEEEAVVESASKFLRKKA